MRDSEEIFTQKVEKIKGGGEGEAFWEKALAMKDLETTPKVIAKGRGEVARVILRIAKECGIPIYEDPDLFEALSILDIGKVIPDELYGLLAEIVSFVYKANLEFGNERQDRQSG